MGGSILVSKPEDLILWEQRINEKNKSGISISEWPKTQGEVRDISKCQLEWLLEGLQIDQKKAHKETINKNGMIF
jgi:hypothetical protein